MVTAALPLLASSPASVDWRIAVSGRRHKNSKFYTVVVLVLKIITRSLP